MVVASQDQEKNNRAIALWLLVCCALIFAMVVLGGVTRLTRSGLSIVEWDPIMGAVPPLSQQAWEQTFAKYKQFPEYQKVNRGMDLDEFKSIFWFEYSHRLLGRLIGLAFLAPLLFFLKRRRITRDLTPKLVIMFILGGLQGLMGWYMVKSGLVDKPHVSQYRLVAHLILAIGIYSYMLWIALGLLLPRARDHIAANNHNRPRALAITVCAAIVLMIISGGFVAGTKAGFAFNTFPTMNGAWIPPGILGLQPWPINFFENIATIQWTHRLLATLLFFGMLVFWFYLGRQKLDRFTTIANHALLGALLLQVTLGISTLLLIVPVALAAAHQAGALILLSCALILTYGIARQGRQARAVPRASDVVAAGG